MIGRKLCTLILYHGDTKFMFYFRLMHLAIVEEHVNRLIQVEVLAEEVLPLSRVF